MSSKEFLEKIGHSVATGKHIICEAHIDRMRVVVRSSELDSYRVIISFEDNGKRNEFSMTHIESMLLLKALSKYAEEEFSQP